MNTCRDCRYSNFTDQAGERQADCRFSPPVAHLIPTPKGPATMTVFPTVNEAQWCGEFRSKAMPDAA